MAEREREHQRAQPTRAGHARLLAAIDAGAPACLIDPGTLGEYAVVLLERGQPAAAAAFPATAEHLGSGCATCAADLQELRALLDRPDDDLAVDDPPAGSIPSQGDTTLHPAALRDALRADDAISLVTERPTSHPSSAPSPSPAVTHGPVTAPRAEPAPSGHRLGRRDWLLIGAAAVVLTIGVALIGMAFFVGGLAYFQASQPALVQPAPTARPAVGPSGLPGQQGVSPSGRAQPNGMNCPPTHPIKGNRDSMIYHPPEGELYGRTRPEECFATPADAEAAGYRRSLR